MVDFGISKVFLNDNDELTGNDFRAVTEEFRAPERCMKTKGTSYGRQCDIWAAGLTLYSLAI
jgi:serine/threonine protein kinase